MRRSVTFALALLTLQASAEVVTAPGTSVALEPPGGLSTSSRFSGWESKIEEAWIQVTELPAPVAEVVAGFRNSERLAAERMTLSGVETVRIASGPAEIFTLNQRTAGSTYRKWVLVMGGGDRTAILTASCAVEKEQKWREPFRRSLLSARWSSQPPTEVRTIQKTT